MIGPFPPHEILPGCSYAKHWFQQLIVLLFLASPQPAAAQDSLLPVFHFRHLSVETGLSSDNVMSQVVRDKNGYIWVGTSGGLDRYDGYSVKHYRNVPGDPHSLASNIVYALTIDSKDRLWVGTYETGLSVYDPRHDRFVNLPHHGGDSSRYNVRGVYVIREDRVGNLWLATDNGGVVCVTMPDGNESADLDSLVRNVRITPYHLGTRRNFSHDLCIWPDGRIFVGSDSGIVIIDPRTQSTSRLRPQNSASRLLDSTFIACILADGEGRLWVGSGTQGLFLVEPVTSHTVNYRHKEGDKGSIKSNEVHHIFPDQRGNLWLSTGQGLDLFSPVTRCAVPFLAFGAGPVSSYCWWISADAAGNQWIGTQGNGLYMLTGKSFRYPLYSLPDSKGSPLPFEGIKRDRQGALWVSSRGTLLQIDIATLRVLKTISVFNEREATLSGYEASATYIDTMGNFWYGSDEHGLFKVHLSSSKISNYSYSSLAAPTSSVRSIAPAPGNGLWIGTRFEPPLRFDCTTGGFSTIQAAYAPYAYGVMTAHDGTLWISAEIDGLIHYDPLSGTVERYKHDPADPRTLSAGIVYRAFEDAGGRIWAGAGTVMNCWDPSTRTFIRYPNQAINPASFVYPLKTDQRGRLWIGNDQYISILDPSEGTFRDFDAWGDFCGRPVDMDTLTDGRILITGQRGISVLSLDSLSLQRTPPPLIITEMAINDRRVATPPIIQGKGLLDLTFAQNVLDFEFAATDVAAPHLVRYSYRLMGVEENWVDPKDRRFVRYAGLEPGEYTFRVKAVSIRNEWPDQEIALVITIAPPWWRTSWAYSAYGILFVGALFLAYRQRLKQIRLKQLAEMEHFQAQHLAEVDHIKSRFFANISHEFRTPLSLILGPAEQLAQTTEDPGARHKLGLIQNNARRLLALVNELLDFARLESGMMRLGVACVDVLQFLRRVVLSFESWAERRHIRLEFQADTGSRDGFIDADKVEKILNNLMSNALKFTPEGGAVTVTARTVTDPTSQESASCEIAVSDTGPGLGVEQISHVFDRFYRGDETHRTDGTGIGLALTKELVELHHGTIAVQSIVGKGSTFTVRIPIERSAYAPEEMANSAPQLEELDHHRPTVVVEEGVPAHPARPAEGKPIILVVEDNAELRSYMRELLEADYVVQESENGKCAFDRAVECVPDIVISDVIMPEMDGMELCRALKQDVRTSHVPVILLTARADTGSKITGFEVGADAYLTKPFDSKELAARVRNLLEQRRQLRRKFSAGVVLKPGEIAVSSIDDTLLQKLLDAVEENMGNEAFGVDDLAWAACLSRTHLNRKLRALVNLSPAEFIRYLRLQRARELLEKNAGTVAEIAYQVGFGNQSHFSAAFKERFGIHPSEVRNTR